MTFKDFQFRAKGTYDKCVAKVNERGIMESVKVKEGYLRGAGSFLIENGYTLVMAGVSGSWFALIH